MSGHWRCGHAHTGDADDLRHRSIGCEDEERVEAEAGRRALGRTPARRDGVATTEGSDSGGDGDGD